MSFLYLLPSVHITLLQTRGFDSQGKTTKMNHKSEALWFWQLKLGSIYTHLTKNVIKPQNKV